MSKRRLLQTLCGLICGFVICTWAGAQTVTVDKTLATTDTTHFKSLRAAIMSFDWVTSTTTGFNAGNAEPNVINITSFGPYDEELPTLFNTSSFTADYKCKLPATDTTITVQGSATIPLLLPRYNVYDAAAVSVLDKGAYVLKNLIIAPSPTDTPTSRLLDALGTGVVDVQNCTVCCLPAASVGYTSIADIPTGVLDATLPFDDSYVACTTPGATTGMAAQASGTGTVRFTNTRITQFGVAATAGVTLCAFQSGTIRLNEGTILRNNTGGIYTRHNDATNKSKLIISGVANNRVMIGKNNPWGNGWLDLRLFSQVDISQCNFIGQPTSCAISVGSNAASLGSLKIADCIIAEGNPATTATAALRIASKPTTFSVMRISILNHGIGYQYYTNAAALTTSLSDSIIAGCYYAFGNSTTAGGTVNANYCGFPAAGATANVGLKQTANVTVNETATVNADPAFTSVLATDTGFAEVTNNAYGGKASDGSHLVGGGTAAASVPVELSTLTLE